MFFQGKEEIAEIVTIILLVTNCLSPCRSVGYPHEQDPLPKVAARGPVDHEVRDQIVAAATEHFRLYGYEKTTVSDLAKAIGFPRPISTSSSSPSRPSAR